MKTLIIAAAAALAAGAAHADAHVDLEAGAEVFDRRCKTCHMIVDDAGEEIVRGGRTGPNLYGVIGRTAGSVEDFAGYGDDLVALGEGGYAWTAEDVTAYVQDPRGWLRAELGDDSARSRMAFRLRGEDDSANIAAYLASFSE